MTLQLVFMIAAIACFLAAAVFISLTVRSYLVLGIRDVKDDLSGKTRQRDLEEGSRRSGKRSSDESRRGSVSGQLDHAGEKRANRKRKSDSKPADDAGQNLAKPAKPNSKGFGDYQAEHLDAYLNPATMTSEMIGEGVTAEGKTHAEAVEDGPQRATQLTRSGSLQAKADDDSYESVGFVVARREVVVNSDEAKR